MRLTEALGPAVKGGINHFLQKAPGPIRRTFSKPMSVYIMITRRCNLRCAMCGIPYDIRPELTVDQWKAILDDVAAFAGGYCKIQFSGGEPLIYEGFLDVLEHAVKRGLLPGFCTNATVINEENAQRIMTMGLENVNVSLDGIGAVHDRIRGEESFERTDKGIRLLIAAREKSGSYTPLILKTCLMGTNAADVPNLIAYTREVGADGLLFQPMEIRSGDWGDNEELFRAEGDAIEKAIGLLIEDKQKSGIVMNGLRHLELFREYFKDPEGDHPGRQQCTVGDTGMMIHCDGAMALCVELGNIGGATETPPSVAWRSKEAEVMRQRIHACQKGCLQTCYARKSLLDKARALLFLLRGKRTARTGPGA